MDKDKVIFDVSAHENLAMSLVSVFDSQNCRGKRYDLATWGRRRTNATHLESHATDVATAMIFGIDLTPLIKDISLDPCAFIKGFIDRFALILSRKDNTTVPLAKRKARTLKLDSAYASPEILQARHDLADVFKKVFRRQRDKAKDKADRLRSCRPGTSAMWSSPTLRCVVRGS